MSGEIDNILEEVIAEIRDKPRAAMFATSASGYNGVRESYRIQIAGLIIEYLFADRSNRTFYSGQMKLLVTEFFQTGFEVGYLDAGSKISDITSEDRSWLTARINAELGYIDMLFLALKDVRDNIDPEEYPDIVDQKAELWTQTLDGVYNEGKIRAGKDVSLSFVGNDGAESCKTCMKWKGKRHRKSFWLKRGLIPGQPGNHNFECGGWNCEHYLITDDGKRYTF